MRVLFAFNAFKGCMTAADACAVAADAARAMGHDARVCPMADGGDGTADVIIRARKCATVNVGVRDPLGKNIVAVYGWDAAARTAVMEMAAASGIALITPARRDPMRTTTYGTGEMIRHAITVKQARHIILGLGGSATVDGGAGAAQALGWQLRDADGNALPDGIGGGDLGRLYTAIAPAHPVTKGVDIELLCDVTNPLLGPNGAAAIYGPQKGASPEQVRDLEDGMRNWIVEVMQREDIATMPGTGAAGGLAAGLIVCCGAKFARGAETVAGLIGLEKAVQEADLIITGEGKSDSQTLMGKAPGEVINTARKHGKPVILLSGRIYLTPEQCAAAGVTKAVSITPSGVEVEIALKNAKDFLKRAVQQVLADQ